MATSMPLYLKDGPPFLTASGQLIASSGLDGSARLLESDVNPSAYACWESRMIPQILQPVAPRAFHRIAHHVGWPDRGSTRASNVVLQRFA